MNWIIELIESQQINISTYRPLSGSYYTDFPIELKNPRKRLLNIKKKDKKCFLWCHVRHVNPSNEHPQRIKTTDKKIAEKLDYDEIEFNKTEAKNNICINVFNYENKLVLQIYVSDQKFEDLMDFLLLIDDDNHTMRTSKILTDLCFTEQKIKTKNGFVRVVYNVIVAKVC